MKVQLKGLLSAATVLASALANTSCTQASGWLQQTKMQNDEKVAAQEVPKPHPVGVIYDVVASSGERKQMSLFFNGEGLARILFRNSGNTKLLLDYNKQEISNKDFNTGWLETKKVDPFVFPCVLSAKMATEMKANYLGKGRTKGFPYHRWGLRKEDNEWEVWTDDNDSFPVYFRAIKNGDVSSWTISNSWIDGSTYDKPTFFSLDEADPPIPTAESEHNEALAESPPPERARKRQHKRSQHVQRSEKN